LRLCKSVWCHENNRRVWSLQAQSFYRRGLSPAVRRACIHTNALILAMRTEYIAKWIMLLLPAILSGCHDFGEPAIVQTPHGNFVLFVSNQSSQTDPVDIKVYLDGRLAVNQNFLAGSGHNWVRFEFQLDGGTHTLRAISTRGQTDTTATFDLPSTPWAVVDFWQNGERKFTVFFSADPPGFM
jgi:hypothetical protein